MNKHYLIYGILALLIIGGLYIWTAQRSYSPTDSASSTDTSRYK